MAFDFYTLQGAINLHKAMREFKGGKLVLNIAKFPFKCPVAPLKFVYMADAYFTERAIAGLGGLDKRFDGEALGRMFAQVLVSADNIGEGLRLLNRFIQFKQDFEPRELSRLLKEFINNIGNLADALKMLGSLMELKRDGAVLVKPAFDEAVERLETLKRKRVFAAF